MNTSDLTALWNVLKRLRDDTQDPTLAAVIEIAMVALLVKRQVLIDDGEQPPAKD